MSLIIKLMVSQIKDFSDFQGLHRWISFIHGARNPMSVVPESWKEKRTTAFLKKTTYIEIKPMHIK